MNKLEYIVNKVDEKIIDGIPSYKEKDEILIGPYLINNLYDSSEDFIDLHIYSLEGRLLKSAFNYTGATQTGDSAGAGQIGAQSLNISPGDDAVKNGFRNGDVVLSYNFFSDLYSNSLAPKEFFIEEISADRTELRLLTLELKDDQIINITDALRDYLENNSHFSDFKLRFSKDDRVTAVAIDNQEYRGGQSVLVKLYKPLPTKFVKKDLLNILENTSDTVNFKVATRIIEEERKSKFLKGPNFDIDSLKKADNPTEFFNYDDLFSYPVSSSYYELYSLFNEKGAQISINHADYGDFIHFGSAEERLRNFKYKVDLLDSYNDSIKIISDTSYTSTGVSGSTEYYEGLIKGLVDNFDHYDKYLYYESGSYSWPKSDNRRPYINQTSSTAESAQWFQKQLVSASNYDLTNYDVLTNTIPTYLREDQANEPLLMFTHMLGQHFDNIWIYFKAVSDKYDTDNRLNFGLSKDLVRDAIETLGIKIYPANNNLSDLFSTFTGANYDSGSTGEVINHYMQITSGSGLEHLQPMPVDNYQKEVYKRIYHNIPFLTKAKGTNRGLRALINCFGIPSDILKIKQFGGTHIDHQKNLAPEQSVTSSLDKIRLDNTGSLVTGSTLSPSISIIQPVDKYSDDLHTVEVGFDISDTTNEWISSKITGSFDIDNYLGDPRDRNEFSYSGLRQLEETIFAEPNEAVQNYWENVIKDYNKAEFDWNDELVPFRKPADFVRLVKFFDNTLFRLIKDFIPARSNTNTGVIIKSHILNRSKVKQVSVSYENNIYTGSISVGEISGSDAGAFGVANKYQYTTSYSASTITPIGLIERNISHEEPRFTGEFSGSVVIASDGEMNAKNPFKHSLQPFANFTLRAFNFSLPIPLACDIVLTVTKMGENFTFTAVGNGKVSTKYPQSSNQVGEIQVTHDFDSYNFLVGKAHVTYPYHFEGWGLTSASAAPSIFQTGSVMTLYNNTRPTVDKYFAHFSTDFAERIVYYVSTRIEDDGVVVSALDGTVSTGYYGDADNIELLYPDQIAPTGSFNVTANWSDYSQFILKANDAYGGTGDWVGWKNGDGDILSTNKQLSIFSGSYGGYTQFYATYNKY